MKNSKHLMEGGQNITFCTLKKQICIVNHSNKLIKCIKMTNTCKLFCYKLENCICIFVFLLKLIICHINCTGRNHTARDLLTSETKLDIR